ncbi:MAG: CDP-diacylglycerol--glycerol-3-phosphate 3-phosphatidyltransferase [Candidatus Kapaibacterium sp.]|nr:MAG: CDP-diacylglycerol--glycerol-3-phosphate 3-phosphatidyltransferase [Candidatus Kapabacteria bacterium]
MHARPTVSIFTIANIVTALRILVAPVFFFLLVQNQWWSSLWALVVFVLAAASDFVDGIVARRFGEVSAIGIFLDPLADKILVLSALFGFVWLEVVPLPMVIVVAIRDVVATVLRVWRLSEGESLSPSRVAKWKTFVQMGFVSVVLLILTLAGIETPVSAAARWVRDSGAITLAMGIVVVLTVATLPGYFRRLFHQ